MKSQVGVIRQFETKFNTLNQKILGLQLITTFMSHILAMSHTCMYLEHLSMCLSLEVLTIQSSSQAQRVGG